jgi:acetolactate synthase small subunit
MDFTLGILVENAPGVLARVTGVVSRRDCNIRSLAVGPTDDSAISFMTLRITAEEAVGLQIERGLQNLVDVLRIHRVAEGQSLLRELMLVKVVAAADRLTEVMQVARTFHAEAIDVDRHTVVLEAKGDLEGIEAMIAAMHGLWASRWPARAPSRCCLARPTSPRQGPGPSRPGTETMRKAGKDMVKSTARQLLECLREEGVEVVFGYPRGAMLPLYHALYDFPIRHVLVRHEQGAAHAADGYARASGKVGVCFATSGPGATNLVTGLANAMMDSIPLVAVTGQVTRPLIGTGAFQEVDTIGVTRPITKHSYLVEDAKDLPRIVHEAFHIARSGRPGPVLIDLHKDVQFARGTFPHPEGVPVRRGYNVPREVDAVKLRAAAQAIASATRSLVIAGGGLTHANSEEALRAFAGLLGAPVASTLRGLGMRCCSS